MNSNSDLMATLLPPIFLILLAAMFVAFVRLVRGPSLPDRVVALDVIASLSMTTIIIYAVATDQPVFIDDAIVLALISFLGTVAFARYVERQGHRE